MKINFAPKASMETASAARVARALWGQNVPPMVQKAKRRFPAGMTNKKAKAAFTNVAALHEGV
jgi:hypothetical protein